MILRMFFFSFLIIVLGYGQTNHAELIMGPFESPHEVTKACLGCHEEAAAEVMKTIHWTWAETEENLPGHPGLSETGKKNVFNNFCIALQSNWPRCTSCHVGYGWRDSTFDFSNQENVDCLVCHDHTGQYKKTPTGAGLPDTSVNLLLTAQSVGAPTRQACGICHFYGGGGENVKHGDLDQGLVNPTKEYDVHMGSGMTCQDCHTTEAHQIKGKSMANNADSENRIRCQDCHESEPHKMKTLNNHSQKIACQTCHIQVYAKAQPTKLYWDWSTAGKDSVAPKDEYGDQTYNKMKGSFRWGKDVVPEYYWYNETSERYLLGDKFDPENVLSLNKPLGKKGDPDSKIYPFKVHRGQQIYDTQNNYLIVPKLFGGYWKEYDWDKAAKEGMKSANLEYSGNYGFVSTEMYWKLNHMVSPKNQSLKCKDCHGDAGRLDWKSLGYEGDPRKIKKN